MKKQDLLFALICIAVIAGLFYLYFTGRHPQPTDPRIPQHQNLTKETPRTTCLTCHDPQTGTNDVAKRIQVNHPEKWKDEKFLCQRCHKIQASQDAKAALSPGSASPLNK